MPTKNDNNWFTQATLNAQMAEAPAIMQASGWDNDPKKGVTIGDPNAEGARMLAESLKQIGIEGLSMLTGEAVGEAAIRGWNKLFNGATPKQILQLIKSRRKYKDIIPNYTPGDLPEYFFIDYTPEELTTNFNVGKYHISQTNTMSRPDIIRMSSKEKAKEAVVELQKDIEAQAKIKPSTTEQKLKELEELKKKIERSGKMTSLVRDGDLSTDSYKPLYDNLLLKNAKEGKGTIIPVMDDGQYRMMRLNNLGVHNTTGATVKSAVRDINTATKGLGFPQLPQPVTIGPINLPHGMRLGPYRFAPAIQYLHYRKGGMLRKLPVIK